MHCCLSNRGLLLQIENPILVHGAPDIAINYIFVTPSFFRLPPHPPLVIHGLGKQESIFLTVPLFPAHPPPPPAFLLEERFPEWKRCQKEKGKKKKEEKETTVRNMTGRCQNNSPVVIFVQRSFNMVTEMHMQYSWDRSQELPQMGFMCEVVIDWLIIVLVINRATLTRTKRTLNKGVKCERMPRLAAS